VRLLGDAAQAPEDVMTAARLCPSCGHELPPVRDPADAIAGAIQAAIEEALGELITPAEARAIGRLILADVPVRRPGPYAVAAVRRQPERWLCAVRPEYVPTRGRTDQRLADQQLAAWLKRASA
jgi:hypothetical protein